MARSPHQDDVEGVPETMMPDYVIQLRRAIAGMKTGDMCEVKRSDLLNAANSLARPTTLSQIIIALASRARCGRVVVRVRQVVELLSQIEVEADRAAA